MLGHFFGFLGSVLVNQPTVHSGGVIDGGRSMAVAVGVGDRRQVTGDSDT